MSERISNGKFKPTPVEKDYYKFDLKKNIDRIIKQQDGDPAFYFLAIISFVEGYFRDKDPTYDYNDDNKEPNDKKRYKLSNILGEEIDKSNQAEITQNLKKLKFLGCRDFDQEGDERYISANRIRHCFAPQLNENITTLVLCFIQFAKHYNFVNEKIEALKNNQVFFKNMINREETNESRMMQEDVKQQGKKLKDQKPSKRVNTEIEILNNKQKMLTMYAQAWRNYQTQMSTLTEEQNNIVNEIINDIHLDKKQNYLIQGGPGTGKTIILISILQNLMQKDILMITFTSSLTKYNAYLANTISFAGIKLSDNNKQDLLNKIKKVDIYLQSQAEKILKKIFLFRRILLQPTIILHKLNSSLKNLHLTTK